MLIIIILFLFLMKKVYEMLHFLLPESRNKKKKSFNLPALAPVNYTHWTSSSGDN